MQAGDDALLLCQYEGNGIDDAAQQLSLTSEEDALVSYKFSTGQLKAQIKVRELRSQGLSFQIWPAAHALCWYLEQTFGQTGMLVSPSSHVPTSQKHQICRNMRVLELGAGTGMVGILCAVLGAGTTITDLPHVIPNLEHNASLNQDVIESTGLGGSVVVKVLRWGEQADVEALGCSFDLIVASDVVYYDHLFEPLLCTLKWLLQAPQCCSLGKGETARNNGDGICATNDARKEEGDSLDMAAFRSTVPLPSCGEEEDECQAQPTNGPGFVTNSTGREDIPPTVLLAHLRRWKKDSKFFRKASKLFQVSVVHKHSSDAKARTGVTVYSVSKKKS